jgi:hypothetical protein
MSITINLNNVQPLDELLTALSVLSFAGNESLYLRVNSTADAFEFAAASGGGGGVWGSITGTLSDQTDLQNALNLKAALAGAAFTGAVSVTTSGSGATLDLTNSGSGTTLNISNSGSGSFLVVDTDKMVVSNNGNVAFDTNTLFVDAVNNRVGVGTSSPSFLVDIQRGTVSGASNTIFSTTFTNSTYSNSVSTLIFGNYYNTTSLSLTTTTGMTPSITLNSGGLAFSITNAASIATVAMGLGRAINMATDQLNVNSTDTTKSWQFGVVVGSASRIGQIIQAAAGQTANLQEWRDSAGVVIGSIESNGNARFRAGNYGGTDRVIINSSLAGVSGLQLYQSAAFFNQNGEILYNVTSGDQANFGGIRIRNISTLNPTIHSPKDLVITSQFAPTSGSSTYTQILLNSTINQTGGASGITRGLYVNPTITAAADYRAIETEQGNVLFKNLPTSSAGLPTGAIWNNGGVLNIV